MDEPEAQPVLSNHVGVVVALFLAAATIAISLVGAVAYYASATGSKRLPRLLSGFANCGNAVVHLYLVVYTLANAGNDSSYWVAERELAGGIEGPVALGVIHLSAGLLALRGSGSMAPATFWNVRARAGNRSPRRRGYDVDGLSMQVFLPFMGSLVPIVWPRCIEEGMPTWPPVVVFLWFNVFTMEVTALVMSRVAINGCVGYMTAVSMRPLSD